MDARPVDWDQPVDGDRRLARGRLALFLAAAVTGVAGAYLFLVFEAMTEQNLALKRVVDNPRWDHFLGGPLVFTNLVASLLLIGHRQDRRWRTRALLLLIACSIGVGLWCVEHSHFFGFEQDHRGGDDPLTVLWLRFLAMIRTALFADLAADIATASGPINFDPVRRSAVGTAILAFVLWIILALTHLDLGRRPPQWRNFVDLGSYSLLAGSILVRAISCGLTALVCGRALVISNPRGREARDAKGRSVNELS